VPHQAGEQAGLHEGGLLGVSRTTAPCAVVALLQLLSLSAVSCCVDYTDRQQCSAYMQWSVIILIG
jgi:hypothetical protein